MNWKKAILVAAAIVYVCGLAAEALVHYGHAGEIGEEYSQAIEHQPPQRGIGDILLLISIPGLIVGGFVHIHHGYRLWRQEGP